MRASLLPTRSALFKHFCFAFCIVERNIRSLRPGILEDSREKRRLLQQKMNFARMANSQARYTATTYVAGRETPDCKNQKTPSATRFLNHCATATIPIFALRGAGWLGSSQRRAPSAPVPREPV
jgi:hypothetical protein